MHHQSDDGGTRMKKVTLFIDDDAAAMSITTVSDKGSYKNVSAMAFDVRNETEFRMPRCVAFINEPSTEEKQDED